jgi:AraC-like DNA-binding protein
MVPFVRLLRRDPAFPQEMLNPLEDISPDDRVPITVMHEMLVGAVAMTGDPDIGLKAAREIAPGDYGALEYCARFASTWGEACQSVGRYMRLINDALRFTLRTEGDRAFIQLESSVAMPRTPSDFQVAAFHTSGSFFRPQTAIPYYEAHFTHARPADVSEYDRTFGGASLRFDAPWNGFVMPRSILDAPVESADPKLHAVIQQHAELLLAELPRAKSVTESVRELVAKELAGGTPSVSSIAHKLTMSPRTLARRLEQENTTFKLLIADLRRRLALRYVGNSDLPLAEIAFLLGFSQSAAFHRAFKRWTRQTPREYRRTHRNVGSSATGAGGGGGA